MSDLALQMIGEACANECIAWISHRPRRARSSSSWSKYQDGVRSGRSSRDGKSDGATAQPPYASRPDISCVWRAAASSLHSSSASSRLLNMALFRARPAFAITQHSSTLAPFSVQGVRSRVAGEGR
jgi:hypothetical protein